MFGIKRRKAERDRLERLEIAVAEYERWFAIYPDFRHMFRAMLHQVQGGPMNAGTPGINGRCTVSGTREQVERIRRWLIACEPCIQLTPAEIQSGLDRVRWAEGLIRQLPETHEGRNSWLLNYAAPRPRA